MAELDRDRLYHERLLTGRLEAKEIRSFGLSNRLFERYESLFEERIKRTRYVVARRIRFSLLASAVTGFGVVLALGAVFLFALDDRISIANVAVAIIALLQLARQLPGIGAAFSGMVEAVAFLRDFETLQALVPPPDLRVHAPSPSGRTAEVVVDNVSYRYPAGDGEAIRNISIRLRRGEIVALVGPNGAGKSTLAKVVCGLLQPTAGCVRWDGVDSTQFAPEKLREFVAPVSKTSPGTNTPPVSRLDSATCASSRTTQRSSRLPGRREQTRSSSLWRTAMTPGYRRRSSEGQSFRSVNGKRLAIVRAFLRDAPLVVMDEPAALLDPRAEQELFGRLAEPWIRADGNVYFSPVRYRPSGRPYCCHGRRRRGGAGQPSGVDGLRRSLRRALLIQAAQYAD